MRIGDQMEYAGMHAVMIGNPVDGMTLVGPFKTGVEAVEWASEHVDDTWHAVPLSAQDSYDGEL